MPFIADPLKAVSGKDKDEEEAELARQYAEAAAQDQIALAGMKDRASRDQIKGLAVMHQKQIWEKNLELRILLQKCLKVSGAQICTACLHI